MLSEESTSTHAQNAMLPAGTARSKGGPFGKGPPESDARLTASFGQLAQKVSIHAIVTFCERFEWFGVL